MGYRSSKNQWYFESFDRLTSKLTKLRIDLDSTGLNKDLAAATKELRRLETAQEELKQLQALFETAEADIDACAQKLGVLTSIWRMVCASIRILHSNFTSRPDLYGHIVCYGCCRPQGETSPTPFHAPSSKLLILALSSSCCPLPLLIALLSLNLHSI